jgi:hypothetical protein
VNRYRESDDLLELTQLQWKTCWPTICNVTWSWSIRASGAEQLTERRWRCIDTVCHERRFFNVEPENPRNSNVYRVFK